MRDFTLKTYRLLLEALKAQHYEFQPFAEFLQNPRKKAVALRHDVDARKLNSLATAKMEGELGVRGTYYFRIVPQSFDAGVIREISGMGHEIGYHYEDLALAKGDPERAIQLFTEHLTKLRQVAFVATICMHGSPLSRHDNRKLWDHYNYKDFGIAGEPYLDVDFSRVLYLTDTGRRWDGEKVSIRDKVVTSLPAGKAGDKGQRTSSVRSEEGEVKGQGEEKSKPSFHSTFDIIHAAKAGLLPAHLMITLHPQRWEDRTLPWMKELFLQNLKNTIKGIITH